MSWIAPVMFWFLLLVPAVLLLWFLKIRRTETVVPSTVLWIRALQDERVRSPFQKLIRNLVLLLQLLAVILEQHGYQRMLHQHCFTDVLQKPSNS